MYQVLSVVRISIMMMFTARPRWSEQLSFSRNISCRQLWLSSVARTKSNWFRWLWLWIIIHTKSLGIPRTPKYPSAQNPVRHAMQPAQNPPRGNCTKNSAGQKWSWPEQETVQKPNFIKYWSRVSPFCKIRLGREKYFALHKLEQNQHEPWNLPPQEICMWEESRSQNEEIVDIMLA